MRPEDHTALAELRSGLRAMAPTARALLPVPLGRGPTHLPARFGVMRTAAAICIDAQHGLLDQRIVALHAEDALVQFHRGDGSAGRVKNLRLCHGSLPRRGGRREGISGRTTPCRPPPT